MKKLTERILHYVTLAVITVGAVWVMWRMSARGRVAPQPTSLNVRSLPPVAAPKSLVAVQSVHPEMCDVTATFSGKIRAWETYRIGFEAGGRVIELGVNADEKPLDVGDRVEAGQILALLDDRALRARRAEASAQVEQAASDLQRAQHSRQNNPNALSEAELQRFVTDLALAQAQLDVTVKNLEDATLRAPVTATISQRMIKAGESVGANQVVFELVQNDRVLLVLNVPESQVRELEARMRQVRRNATNAQRSAPPEDCVFRAHVQPEGKNVFGNPWSVLEGKVNQIAEVADSTTSLFEVEVELSNKDRLLRPGMVATAQLVTDRIHGYKIPSIGVIHRQAQAYLFTAVEEPAEMELLYWRVGDAILNRARRVDLTEWAEQGDEVVVPAKTIDVANVVTRGQYRLADGQYLRIVDDPGGVEIQTTSSATNVEPSVDR